MPGFLRSHTSILANLDSSGQLPKINRLQQRRNDRALWRHRRYDLPRQAQGRGGILFRARYALITQPRCMLLKCVVEAAGALSKYDGLRARNSG
jgi:hypothetical protein